MAVCGSLWYIRCYMLNCKIYASLTPLLATEWSNWFLWRKVKVALWALVDEWVHSRCRRKPEWRSNEKPAPQIWSSARKPIWELATAPRKWKHQFVEFYEDNIHKLANLLVFGATHTTLDRPTQLICICQQTDYKRHSRAICDTYQCSQKCPSKWEVFCAQRNL